MIFRPLVLALAVSCATALPGFGHEFWIEAGKYQVQSGDTVIADLRNGQQFSGIALAYFDHRATRFDLILNEQTTPYTGRMGDIPALSTAAAEDGLLVIVHETAPSSLKYKEWDKFADFAAQKDIPDILARHRARNLPMLDFYETYTRYAKALIGIGKGQGQDQYAGLKTEIVARANPYTDDLSQGLPVTLFYQDAPRPDAQIEVFERAESGDTRVFTIHTDAEGQALIPVRAGHDYLLDAVVLRPAPEGGQAVWQTLWASLTFRYP